MPTRVRPQVGEAKGPVFVNHSANYSVNSKDTAVRRLIPLRKLQVPNGYRVFALLVQSLSHR